MIGKKILGKKIVLCLWNGMEMVWNIYGHETDHGVKKDALQKWHGMASKKVAPLLCVKIYSTYSH